MNYDAVMKACVGYDFHFASLIPRLLPKTEGTQSTATIKLKIDYTVQPV